MVKRGAQSELNADNWDREEKVDQPQGEAKTASTDVLQRRTIIKAKRRNPGSGSGGGGLFKFASKPVGGDPESRGAELAQKEKPLFAFGGSTAKTAPENKPFSFLSTASTSVASTSNPSAAATPMQTAADAKSKPGCDDLEKDEKFQLAIRRLNAKFVKSVTDFVKGNPCVDLKPCFDSYNKHFLKIVESYATESVIETLQANGCRDLKISSPESGVALTTSSAVKKPKPEAVEKPAVASSLPEQTSRDSNSDAPKPFAFKSSAPTFNFGGAKSNEAPSSTAKATPFTFGGSTTTESSTNGNKPFNFGGPPAASNSGAGKAAPFNFTFGGAGAEASSSKVAAPPAAPVAAEKPKEGEPSDSVPEIQEKKFKETGVQYEIRCKLYYKTDEGFQERGVGTLFIKKDDDGKGSILVRAENASGSVLLNSCLSAGMPLGESGKNNLMIVCQVNPPIPKQDELTGKTNPFLIKVKSADQRAALSAAIEEFV